MSRAFVKEADGGDGGELAELVPAPVGRSEVVRFGSRVELRTAAGQLMRFRIVGEDEADPASGLISWVAPIAEQLLGARVGDEVTVPGGVAELLSIDDQIDD